MTTDSVEAPNHVVDKIDQVRQDVEESLNARLLVTKSSITKIQAYNLQSKLTRMEKGVLIGILEGAQHAFKRLADAVEDRLKDEIARDAED
mgnify:CR=1 FL=1